MSLQAKENNRDLGAFVGNKNMEVLPISMLKNVKESEIQFGKGMVP
jgi:hypothetical protein